MKKYIIFLLILGVIIMTMENANAWEGIVVHHSSTQYGTVEAIRKYHIEHNSWNDIGYHYVIYRDGTIHNARPIGKVGAHALGRNRTHIGICVVGEDKFTNTQKNSLRFLCILLIDKFNIKSIERHHDTCPGESLNVEGLQARLLPKR